MPERFWAEIFSATATAAGRQRSGLQWEHNIKYNNKITLKSPNCLFKGLKHHREVRQALYTLKIGFQDDYRENPYTEPIDVVLILGCHEIPGFFESSILPLKHYLPKRLFESLIEQWDEQTTLPAPYTLASDEIENLV